MPELPEVETVVRGIRPGLVGRKVKHVEVRTRKLRIAIPREFEKTLAGRTVEAVERRAKYCLIHLSGGWVWVIHLGMSGQVLLTGPGTGEPASQEASEPSAERHVRASRPAAGVSNIPSQEASEPSADKHLHVIVTFDNDLTLSYRDPRKFGLMTVIPENALERHKLMQGMGPEPLTDDFNVFYLHGKLRGKSLPIKQALMDQRIVVGIGNIYANEALYRARIMPFKEAGKVSNASLRELVPAVKEVLEEAIASGGSTLRDYVRSSGDLGYFQHNFQVYERENKPCPRCGLPIKRAVLGGRSTYYCEGCQR